MSQSASLRKNPSSSKKTDKNVSDKKRDKIFKGFIAPDAVKPAQASLTGKTPLTSKKIPPASAVFAPAAAGLAIAYAVVTDIVNRERK